MIKRCLTILMVLSLSGAIFACNIRAPDAPTTVNPGLDTVPSIDLPDTRPPPIQSTPTNALTPTAAANTPSVPIVLSPENLSAGDPYAPELGNAGYDVQHYTLALALDPRETYLEGNARIEAFSTTENLQEIALDFIGFEVTEITLAGVVAFYLRQGDKLIIQLPAPFSTGEAIVLEIHYRGEPVRQASAYVPFTPYLGLFYQPENNSLFVAAEPDGARYWFPVNDHPRDKATYRFELSVPPGLVGLANGLQVESPAGLAKGLPNGEIGDLFVWEHNYPLASAFVTIAVGDYRIIEGASPGGILLRHYAFPEQQEAYQSMQPVIGEMIDWMSDLFGAYPFEAFGYYSTTGLGAALETQTMVILSETDITDENRLAHEMAHMWFGDWVSLDSWGKMWRSEGLATYVSAMWLDRHAPAELENRIAIYKRIISEDPPGYPLNDPPPGELFSLQSYLKGAVLIHELRQLVGDQAFFSGLQTYLVRYGGNTASDEEFQSTMEEAAGFSLDDFFAAWFR